MIYRSGYRYDYYNNNNIMGAGNRYYILRHWRRLDTK